MMNRLCLFVLLVIWFLPINSAENIFEDGCKDLISTIEEVSWEKYPERSIVKLFESMDETCLTKFIEKLHLGNPKYIDFSLFILDKVSKHKVDLIGELQYLLSVNSDRIFVAIRNRHLGALDIVCGTSTSKYYSMARQSIDERLDAVLNSSLGEDFNPIVTRCIDKLENAEKEMLEGMWK